MLDARRQQLQNLQTTSTPIELAAYTSSSMRARTRSCAHMRARASTITTMRYEGGYYGIYFFLHQERCLKERVWASHTNNDQQQRVPGRMTSAASMALAVIDHSTSQSSMCMYPWERAVNQRGRVGE